MYLRRVALRKESVDRNIMKSINRSILLEVALRKESVDRNPTYRWQRSGIVKSLSARRAWIEINVGFPIAAFLLVALRKESVDRNPLLMF